MKVYYIQNEKQLKKLIYHLVINTFFEFDDLGKLYMHGCDYIADTLPEDEGFDPHEINCQMCELDECLLFDEHANDKDVLKHMYVDINEELVYPFLAIFHDDIVTGRTIELIPVQEAKDNMKYLG